MLHGGTQPTKFKLKVISFRNKIASDKSGIKLEHEKIK